MRDKYFATVPCSTTGDKFSALKFQIDSAATCNTISEESVAKCFPDVTLNKSRYILHPYGDSQPTPLGQITLLCEKFNKYHTLEFQVLPTRIITGKPALLSGKDSVRMGIMTINADNVYFLQKTTTTKTTTPRKENRPLPTNKPITKEDVLSHYAESFTGIGCLQPPVSFTVKHDVVPIQMPIHRVPLSKREKEKAAIDRYVAEGILESARTNTMVLQHFM